MSPITAIAISGSGRSTTTRLMCVAITSSCRSRSSGRAGRRWAAASSKSTAIIWVPMDDDNCMVWNFYHSYGEEGPIGKRAHWSAATPMARMSTVKNGFRSFRNSRNDWGIDRQMQKTETFTGIAASISRIARCRRAWGRSSIAPGSIWGRPTRRSSRRGGCCSRRWRSSSAGGNPPGVDASYYSGPGDREDLPATDRLARDGFARDVRRRDTRRGKITRGGRPETRPFRPTLRRKPEDRTHRRNDAVVASRCRSGDAPLRGCLSPYSH